jgi:energy-converting hydrogenase A subunit M
LYSLRAAMESDDFRAALYETCRRLLAEGHHRDLILAYLSALLDDHRSDDDEGRERAVLEVMDLLEGGASGYALHRFFEGT